MSKIKWRSELIDVKKSRDEVWLAEKFQSNSEIALGLASRKRYAGVEH